jgi:Na+-translocating ferredoxin:NAD+ oxidoreductase RnfC subunit
MFIIQGDWMDLNTLKDIIFENGIIGAGGAGFPTHMKLSDKTEVVILNSCECEPLLKVDKELLSTYAEEVLKSLALVVETIGAKEGIVALKNTYKDAIAAVSAVIERYPTLIMKVMEDVYPAGDEVVLVYETTGRIVPEGGLPIDVNAVVVNTETILNLYNAVYLRLPVTDTYITVTGAVNKPRTLKVPVGTSIEKLIRYVEGASIPKYKVIMGGPMTGKIADEQAAVTKTTKAVILLPQEHPLIVKKETKVSADMKKIMAVCSQCQVCTEICPRFLLGHSIKPHKVMNAIANGLSGDIEAFTTTMLCSDCGLCEMYSCYQGLSPRALISEVKSRLRQKGVKNPHKRNPDTTDNMREYRKVPKERLVARLSLSQYNNEAPLKVIDLDVCKVRIPLIQHIGAPAVPLVRIGDKVIKGQLIADMEEGKLGARIHSSINGEIVAVDGGCITIEERRDFHG